MRLAFFILLLTCACIANVGAVELSHIKPIRFDHGHPIIIRIGDECLVLEFETVQRKEADERSHNTFKVKAPYRLKKFKLNSTQAPSATFGQVIEHYRFKTVTRADGKVTRQLTDLGSIERIEAGVFSLGWSNGGSGKASWLYFGRIPDIQFIQQVQDIPFDRLDHEMIASIVDAQNVFRLQNDNANHIAIGAVSKSKLLGENGPRIIGITRQGSLTGLVLEGLQIGAEYAVQRSNHAVDKKWKSAGSFVAESDSQTWYPTQDGSAPFQFFRLNVGQRANEF